MEEEDFDDIVIEEDTGDEGVVENVETEITFTDPEWSSYVLSLLDDSEKMEKNDNVYPFCHGLRRVAQKLLGHVSGGVRQVIYPERGNMQKVTVVYDLCIEDAHGKLKSYTEVSDVSVHNTEEFYLAHAAATASTKAESRCLRKAMLLNCATADEIGNISKVESFKTEDTSGEFNTEEPASGPAINYIDKICKKLNINAAKLLEDVVSKKHTELIKSDVKQIQAILDDYKGKRKEIPEKLTGFIEDWRNEE